MGSEQTLKETRKCDTFVGGILRGIGVLLLSVLCIGLINGACMSILSTSGASLLLAEIGAFLFLLIYIPIWMMRTGLRKRGIGFIWGSVTSTVVALVPALWFSI